MDMNAAFPSTYLKAADLKGKAVPVVIENVTFEDIGGDQKPVLRFRGTDRGMVLNKTNMNIIAEMYGFESDDWHGKRITLQPARVEFQGKIVDAVRVKLETTKQFVSKPIKASAGPNGARQGIPPSHAVDTGFTGVDDADMSDLAINDEIPF
jgi:hypothetical protein